MDIIAGGKEAAIKKLADEIWEKMPCPIKAMCCCCCSSLMAIKSIAACCTCCLPDEVKESIQKLMGML
eukprot:CAMPEP_0167756516 /NCGR_PEP_ID=MMETSP0110_2-20121227/9427_1 /TAXON_ID=629695 /ORGANISM="Gymnochlora sp., Strain CCMP2014" /LENGTH=67 /DNA_ID=CAMNT_0007642631 /DNA_START=63 /DNA_END=266 /DNA_ORIENTATION=+